MATPLIWQFQCTSAQVLNACSVNTLFGVSAIVACLCFPHPPLPHYLFSTLSGVLSFTVCDTHSPIMFSVRYNHFEHWWSTSGWGTLPRPQGQSSSTGVFPHSGWEHPMPSEWVWVQLSGYYDLPLMGHLIWGSGLSDYSKPPTTLSGSQRTSLHINFRPASY